MISIVYSEKNEYGTISMSTSTKKLGDFIVGEDGYYVFFPASIYGYYNEYHLSTLLNKLKELNKEWDDKVTMYFNIGGSNRLCS